MLLIRQCQTIPNWAAAFVHSYLVICKWLLQLVIYILYVLLIVHHINKKVYILCFIVIKHALWNSLGIKVINLASFTFLKSSLPFTFSSTNSMSSYVIIYIPLKGLCRYMRFSFFVVVVVLVTVFMSTDQKLMGFLYYDMSICKHVCKVT